jgi:D-glycero-D-manno-heptose 1,7-bisphosphate phosphatase
MDRDGTVIEDIPYLSDPEKVELIPGTGKAISKLNRRGVMAILVTNQSGITRGYYSVETVVAIHQRLGELLEEEGARLDSIYYCPHLPHEELETGAEGCDCRKPGMGMILCAQRDHNIDLKRSFILGDKLTDVELARKMGGMGILVKTGDGLNSLGKIDKSDRYFHVCDDLSEAIDHVLSLIPTT